MRDTISKIKERAFKTAGCIVLLFGLLWTWEWASLFYDYHHGAKLFYVVLPDWYVLLNSLAGIVISWLAFRLLKSGTGLLKALLSVTAIYLQSLLVAKILIS